MENLPIPIQQFEQRRTYLRSIAFRMLGSLAEAEDAVQETWIRIAQNAEKQIENWDGWAVTVLTRICLDILRRRKSRTEESIESEYYVEHVRSNVLDPEEEAEMSEAVGAALLMVLNTLNPAERLAFVMHDMFEFSFEEIANVLGKSAVTVRQLASRARRKMRVTPFVSRKQQQDQRVVSLFLTYLRDGDMNGLMSVLHPDVVRRADATAVLPPGELQITGRTAVSREAATNTARARFAQVALIDDQIGIVVAPHGQIQVALLCTVADGMIIAFDVFAEPKKLRGLDVKTLPELVMGAEHRNYP